MQKLDFFEDLTMYQKACVTQSRCTTTPWFSHNCYKTLKIFKNNGEILAPDSHKFIHTIEIDMCRCIFEFRNFDCLVSLIFDAKYLHNWQLKAPFVQGFLKTVKFICFYFRNFDKGPFTNYVDNILKIFNPPPSVDKYTS